MRASRCGIALVLWFGVRSAATAAEEGARESIPPDGLRAEDEVEQVRTLWALAEAGRKASGAEGDIAALMTESPRGRRLSRWCYHALARISEHPEKHFDRYMKAATWVPTTVAKPVGDGDFVAGAIRIDAGDDEPPELPESMREQSNAAWRTCVRAIVLGISSKDPVIQRFAGFRILKLRVPPEIATPILADILSDEAVAVEVRCLAARGLGLSGRARAAVEGLLKGLKYEALEIRVTCAAALADLPSFRGPGFNYPEPDSVAQGLIETLGGTAPEVRARAASALGSLVSRGKLPKRLIADMIVPALMKTLKDSASDVRRGAITGLATAGPDARPAVPALIRRFEGEPDAKIRRSILQALQKIAAPEAVPALIEALHKDPDSYVRREAAGALGAVGTWAQENDPEEFGRLAGVVVPHLVTILKGEPKGENRYLVQAAAGGLWGYGPAAKEAVPDLARVLRDVTDRDLKSTVITVLGRIGPAAQEAVPDMLPCASERHWWCKYQLAIALRKIGRGGKEVEETLLGLLDSKNPWIRGDAAKSLGVLAEGSDRVMDALEKLLDDEGPEVSEKSEEAIRAIRVRRDGVEPEDVETF